VQPIEVLGRQQVAQPVVDVRAGIGQLAQVGGGVR
jgi:hypothetical protein